MGVGSTIVRWIWRRDEEFISGIYYAEVVPSWMVVIGVACLSTCSENILWGF
jgi:hypothetical protein